MEKLSFGIEGLVMDAVVVFIDCNPSRVEELTVIVIIVIVDEDDGGSVEVEVGCVGKGVTTLAVAHLDSDPMESVPSRDGGWGTVDEGRRLTRLCREVIPTVIC